MSRHEKVPVSPSGPIRIFSPTSLATIRRTDLLPPHQRKTENCETLILDYLLRCVMACTDDAARFRAGRRSYDASAASPGSFSDRAGLYAGARRSTAFLHFTFQQRQRSFIAANSAES